MVRSAIHCPTTDESVAVMDGDPDRERPFAGERPTCVGPVPVPVASRDEPRPAAVGGGVRETAPFPAPRSSWGCTSRWVMVPRREFPGSLRSACAVSHDLGGLPLSGAFRRVSSGHARGVWVRSESPTGGSTIGRPEGRSGRGVSRGRSRAAGMRSTAVGLRPSRPWRTRDTARSLTRERPPGGPALCQTLSRLTESAAAASDMTGVSFREFETRRSFRSRGGEAIVWSRVDSDGCGVRSAPRHGPEAPRPRIVPSRHGGSPRDNPACRRGPRISAATPVHRRWTPGLRSAGSEEPTGRGRGVRVVFVRFAWGRSVRGPHPGGSGPLAGRPHGDEDFVISLSKSVTLEKEAIAGSDIDQRPIGRKITCL